ncbi:MAG: 16S rRNA processing protein RimM, partial [Thermoleophilia bacterium]|nr:16S rRNA processing protein RimM [Thermoleophilia bacterium]
MARPQWIEVGRISRAHGVSGEVRILSSSDNPERFSPGAVVYGRPRRAGVLRLQDERRIRLTVESVRGDENFPIVAFAEVQSREAAEALRGYVLEIEASQLPELDEDEFYLFDLVGLQVRSEQGQVLGYVHDVVESPAHALLA